VKVLAHFLAETANFASDGTFTVFRGGIDQLASDGFPAFARLVLVTRLELTRQESRVLNELFLEVEHEGHLLAPRVGQPLAVRVPEQEKPIYVNSIAQLNIVIPSAGVTVFKAAINEGILPWLYLTSELRGATT
jgi:hypothetical protein